MKTSTSILFAAAATTAVGLARVVQEKRHQRQRNAVVLAGVQIDWLTQVSANPDLAAMWAPEDLDGPGYQKYVAANRLFCQLSLRHRLGFVSPPQLHFHATELMKAKICRDYWRRFGSVRTEEAIGSEGASRFNSAMAAALHAYDTRPPADKAQPVPAAR